MSAFLCFCVPLFSSRGDGVVQAGALFAADPTKRTIWSLMTLPSSSTVRIFWVGKKSEGHSEKRSQARARVRAQGCLGGGCERGREESAALSVVRSIHSQSRRRWWRCRTPCRCRPARVGVLWGGAQRREGEHGGGGGGAPGTGETEKKKPTALPLLKRKTHRKPQQQAGLAHARVADQQQLCMGGRKWGGVRVSVCGACEKREETARESDALFPFCAAQGQHRLRPPGSAARPPGCCPAGLPTASCAP